MDFSKLMKFHVKKIAGRCPAIKSEEKNYHQSRFNNFPIFSKREE